MQSAWPLCVQQVRQVAVHRSVVHVREQVRRRPREQQQRVQLVWPWYVQQVREQVRKRSYLRPQRVQSVWPLCARRVRQAVGCGNAGQAKERERKCG